MVDCSGYKKAVLEQRGSRPVTESIWKKDLDIQSNNFAERIGGASELVDGRREKSL